VNFFSPYVKKMKSTASVGTKATFFSHKSGAMQFAAMFPDAFADDIMVAANTSSAENKHESVPQSDAGAFDMMSSAKASGLVYKTSFSFFT